MKVIAIIPSRYNSSRFPGKPLADIHGKPMIWWTYQQVCKIQGLDGVFVATDDERIVDICARFSIKTIMTSSKINTMEQRIWEAYKKLEDDSNGVNVADVIVVVNGDEPLINFKVAQNVIPVDLSNFYATNLITKITDPVEVVDNTSIKMAINEQGRLIYASRQPIPYPKGVHEVTYYKHLGVFAYSPEALEFIASSEQGVLERVEDIGFLRFLEHNKSFQTIVVNSDSLSVDTPKDLEYVRKVIAETT
jgi:3-deoxy-manno-octulosonate cytidylyltransferase (CMP-KDO synthetase)